MSALDEALSALWVARRQLSAQMDQIDKAIDALRDLGEAGGGVGPKDG